MNDIETYDSFFSQFAGVTPDDIVAYKKGGHVKKDKCGCKAKMLQSGGTQDDDANDNAIKGFLNNTMTKEEQQKNRERWKKENQEQKKASQKKTKQPDTAKLKKKTTQTPKK